MIAPAEALDCAGDLHGQIAHLPEAAQFVIAEYLLARIIFALPEPEKSEIIELCRRDLEMVVNKIGALL